MTVSPLYITIIPFRSASVDSPFYYFCNSIEKDGKPGTASDQVSSPGKRGGVWTLNLQDGNLFLFKTNPKDVEAQDGQGDSQEREGERGGKEDDTELVQGIELSKLLTQTPQSPVRHFAC